jgi:Flp pilus assembly protein TadG
VQKSARNRAQALVEFALIVPVMLLLVLGMFDLGRAFVFAVAVQNGAREAARMGERAALDPTVTNTLILQRLIDASAPALTGCTAQTGTQPSTGCSQWTFTLSPTGTLASGNTLTVTAVGHVSLLGGMNVGGLNLPTITVQGQAEMLVF